MEIYLLTLICGQAKSLSTHEIQDFDMMSYRYQSSNKLLWHKILLETASQEITSYLSIADVSDDWAFYLRRDQLIYASSSLNSFGSLEHYLRYLQAQIVVLIGSIRAQLCPLFEMFPVTDMRQDGDFWVFISACS